MTITAPGATAAQTFTAKEKTIFEDFDFLGRITANLGTWLPGNNAAAGAPLPQAYINPNTDTVADGQVEIWRVTHNGVDMHPIHFHLVNLQVLARIGWDGVVRQPEPTEAGWKETIQMVPMTDILVAVKAKTPKIPFGVPNSVRPLDPSQPLGSTLYFTQVDPVTGQPANFTNQLAEFNWEYVWHCHILGHEENDLMRPLTLNFAATVPTNAPVLSAPATVGSLGASVNLTWTDPTPVLSPIAATDPASEIGFRVEKAPVANGVVGAYGAVGTVTEYKKGVVNGSATKLVVNALANATGATDTIGATGDWSYRVYAVNAAGDSGASNEVTVVGVPAAPTAPAIVGNAVGADTIALTWNDAATNETGYLVEYSADTGASWSTGATLPAPNANGAIVTGLTPNTPYQFRISAVNSAVTGSAGTNSAVISAPTLPAVTGLTNSYAAATRKATLTWADAATLETGYVVQRQIGTVNAISGAVTWGVATNTALAANTTTWTSPALTANTLYRFSVYPVSGTLTGPVSSIVMASTATANLIPSAPTQMQVTAGATAGTTKVQWQSSATAGLVTGYEIQRCAGTAAACAAANAVWTAANPGMVSGSNSTKVTDTGLVSRATYTYRVRAINSQITTLVSNWGPLKAGAAR